MNQKEYQTFKLQSIKMLSAAFPSNDKTHINWNSIFSTGEFVVLEETGLPELENLELSLHSDFAYDDESNKEQEMFYIKLGVKELSSSVGIIRSGKKSTVIEAIMDFKSKLKLFSNFINHLAS